MTVPYYIHRIQTYWSLFYSQWQCTFLTHESIFRDLTLLILAHRRQRITYKDIHIARRQNKRHFAHLLWLPILFSVHGRNVHAVWNCLFQLNNDTYKTLCYLYIQHTIGKIENVIYWSEQKSNALMCFNYTRMCTLILTRKLNLTGILKA